ncbi:MAG: tRNA (5-methylaminomethyl-2-thiouridine)(34)-methyltransferase MnmD [Chitinophagaceae bacterium]
MLRTVQITKDGSATIAIPDMQVTYHSHHGAVQESRHVFINAGLMHQRHRPEIEVFEMGLGTGLNALLTFEMALAQAFTVRYTSIEKFPLRANEWSEIDYSEYIKIPDTNAYLNTLHESTWNEWHQWHAKFSLHKIMGSLLEVQLPANTYHVIYFDAFAPTAQPELWSIAVFATCFNALVSGGCLVTYCSKGVVRRAMESVGFLVEKLPGPPGKREMVRAIKP